MGGGLSRASIKTFGPCRRRISGYLPLDMLESLVTSRDPPSVSLNDPIEVTYLPVGFADEADV